MNYHHYAQKSLNEKRKLEKIIKKSIVMVMSKNTENKSATYNRVGPVPLSMHIGMAHMYAASPENITNVPLMQSEMKSYLEGIKKYQDHDYKREEYSHDVVWECGAVKLYKVPSSCEDAIPVLLVPSLINKSYVFDLLPQRSFARFLSTRGFDVYICDWGDVVSDPDMATIDLLVAKKLEPLIDYMCSVCDEFHALGYCVGGTLLACMAAQKKKRFKSLTCLAAPWDFHAGDRRMETYVRASAPIAHGMMASLGELPVQWIQSIFAVVSAEKTTKKFLKFSELDNEGDDAQVFVAVEDWLNDGLALPSGIAGTIIDDWYEGNKICKAEWSINGDGIDASKIDSPVLVVAAENDHIVPHQSAQALCNYVCSADSIVVSCGHVALMTSRTAQEKVWEPIASWIKNNHCI